MGGVGMGERMKDETGMSNAEWRPDTPIIIER